MEIRYLNADDDLNTVSGVYESSWKYAYKGIIPQDYLDSIPEGRWAGRLNRDGWHNLVATENDLIVGTACFCKSRWERYSEWGEIVSIYFLPGYIGKGYGRPLLEKCVEELRKLGFEKLLLWVLEENTRARGFYERNGFVCAEEYLDDKIGGRKLREVLYTMQSGSS